MLQGLIWDVDGTIAETERDGHRVAFNRAFKEFGLRWRWDVPTYGALLGITGGRERLLHDFARRPEVSDDPAERDRLARALHARKNALYALIVASGALPARPGVLLLMRAARRAGLRQAIATTTSRANVDALMHSLLGAEWTAFFAAVVCGEDVERKKPHPAVYRQALDQLALAPAHCLAVEDSWPGLAAAQAAGVPVAITRSVYFAELAGEGALWCGPDLQALATGSGAEGDALLAALRRLHATAGAGAEA
jgi:HAD superfamily hydrolase (TIGR01509 family)